MVVLAIATFALLGIGSPLLGSTIFAGTDIFPGMTLYRDAGIPATGTHTINLGDTIDAGFPRAAVFGDAIRHGHITVWDPNQGGGAPLGATPNEGLGSPVAIAYWLLPAWLAPAYLKLLEIICGIGGCFLYLRRLRLGRAAALLGGLVFTSSAFLIVWTNWPQTRVATFIPAFFWALECLVQQRRIRDGALVALTVAAMLFGGFPSVTGYALLTGAGYLLVRVLAQYGWRGRRPIGVLAGAAAGVFGGVALTAVQLLPFVYFMSGTLIRGRGQGPGDHIPFELLSTTIAPFAFGTTNPTHQPLWFHIRILIEENAYFGAAAVVLAVTAVALARYGRQLLPRGVWLFTVLATLGWAELVFLGGPPLAVAQKLPVLFEDNFVGRARSILGFLVAVLAATGFELLLRRRTALASKDAGAVETAVPGRLARAYPIVVWIGSAVIGGYAILRGFHWAQQKQAAQHRTGLSTFFLHQVAIGLVFVAAAAACAAFLWFGPALRSGNGRGTGGPRLARFGGSGFVRFAAAVAIPALIAVQGLMLVRPYYPRSERFTFYPETQTHQYLAEHLGHQRFYGVNGAIFGGTDIIHGLRGLHAHSFLDSRFAELVEELPGKQLGTPATVLGGIFADGAVVRSPVLDRLGVSYYVVPQELPVLGHVQPDTGDGSAVALAPDRPVTVPLPVHGPVRAVGVTPVGLAAGTALTGRISIELRDGTGRTVTRTDRMDWSAKDRTPFYVALPAEQVSAEQQLTAVVTLHGGAAMRLAARSGTPALSVVTGTGDGLRVVDGGPAVIYQRQTALPRVRWASRTVVEPDAARRLDLLASGQVPADTVVLDAPGTAADGEPATVRWRTDAAEEMALDVDATGDGYLVFADAIRRAWSVTVDGKPATFVPADHGLVAVAVPAGSHTVRARYATPYHGAGTWISGLTALLGLGLIGAAWWRRRRSAPRPPA